VSIQILGKAEVIAKLALKAALIERGAKIGTKLSAERMVKIAKSRAPVLSGKLRDSIDILGEEKDGAIQLVGTRLPYSVYVEYGTSHQTKEPYVRPAVNEVKSTHEGTVRLSVIKTAGL